MKKPARGAEHPPHDAIVVIGWVVPAARDPKRTHARRLERPLRAARRAPRPTVEALRAKVATRLARVPRFRQRLAFPPLRLAEPSWVDDHELRGRQSCDRARGGDEPVPLEQFRRLTDATLSEPLDRARPLWHLYLVPRLADGRLGLIFKMHHALVDGKSAVELALLLFDTPPTPSRSPRMSGVRPLLQTPRASRSTRSPAMLPSRCARRAAWPGWRGARAKAVSRAR